MTDYEIEFEIFEGDGSEVRTDGTLPDLARQGPCTWMCGGEGDTGYRVGRKFYYPGDPGEMCPRLLDSLTGVVRALEHGGTLSWNYRNAPYEK